MNGKMIRKTVLVGFVTFLVSAGMVQGVQTNEIDFTESQIEKTTNNDGGVSTPLLVGSGMISPHFFSVIDSWFEFGSCLYIYGEGYLEYNGEIYSFPNGLHLFTYGLRCLIIFIDDEPVFKDCFAPFFIAW